MLMRLMEPPRLLLKGKQLPRGVCSPTAYADLSLPLRSATPSSVAKPKNKQPESQMQMLCVSWARGQDLVVVGTAGGAHYAGGPRQAVAMKKRGVEPGIPDLLILEPGADGSHGLAVELKVRAAALRPAQQAWFEKARAKRWRCEVVRGNSPTDGLVNFKQLVRQHMGTATDTESGGAQR